MRSPLFSPDSPRVVLLAIALALALLAGMGALASGRCVGMGMIALGACVAAGAILLAALATVCFWLVAVGASVNNKPDRDLFVHMEMTRQLWGQTTYSPPAQSTSTDKPPTPRNRESPSRIRKAL